MVFGPSISDTVPTNSPPDHPLSAPPSQTINSNMNISFFVFVLTIFNEGAYLT